MASLRTLLVLGRVSNLPTVWSNCLAGWLLGGGGDWQFFLLLVVGASSLYVGGMFLNDAFDAGFDRQLRPERPIPSGAIRESAVWWWAFGWILGGAMLLIPLGRTTAWLAVLLVTLIVLYDAVHKWITFAPVLMAGCRLLLYLVAASAADRGVTGLAGWSALALAAYVLGLSYIARGETARAAVPFWPAYLLAAPVVLSVIVNSDAGMARALVLSLLLAAWTLRCLKHVFFVTPPDVGRAVSGLLAGIVLVDLLAVAPDRYPFGVGFLLLFAAAVVLQKVVPAT
jgi:4-hydroxybenzoate polyprenyltransferase